MRTSLLAFFLACRGTLPTDTAGDADTDVDADADADTDSDSDPGPFAGDPDCQPADEAPDLHAPSQHRGFPVDPVGGSDYDPRLANCTWQYDLAGVNRQTVFYDAVGRPVSRTIEYDAGGTTFMDFGWSDDGCLLAESITTDVDSGTWLYACDHHGYPICMAHDEAVVQHNENEYSGDDLVVVETGFSTVHIGWSDGRVATYSESFGTEAGYTLVYTYDGDDIVRVDTLESDGGAAWTAWTYDEAGHALSREDESGLVLTYTYDVGHWPISATDDSDGSVYATISVSCGE